MNEPLGTYVGNALEMREILDILGGKGPPDTTELTLVLGSEMLILGGRADSSEHARQLLRQAIDNGAGLARAKAVFQAQGGDLSVMEDPEWGKSAHFEVLYAPRSGFISRIDALAVGEIARALGAGRMHVDDVIDPNVGMMFFQKSGAHVDMGEPLAHVFHRGDPQSASLAKSCLKAFSFSDDPTEPEALILEIQRGKH
jgi:pyrimidine-nucleoside phosphorylase